MLYALSTKCSWLVQVVHYNYVGAREVNSLKVQCESDDCTWQGELRSLAEHVDSCKYATVECPNGCEISNLAKKDLEVHLESQCPKRNYTCPHCDKDGEHNEMTTTHLEECPDMEVKCPNLGCEKFVPRADLEVHHETTCDYQLTACKYATVGCKEIYLRKYLEKHEKNDQFHLHMTIDKVLQLDQDKTLLQEQLLAQNEQIRALEKKIWKSTSFKFKVYRFQYSNVVQSPSFYSHHGGYKMFVKVYTKGNGVGRLSHVSVFTFLMEGDNDDSLMWPFTGSVTIELLNQLEDDSHLKLTITFPADHGASKRVVDGKRSTGLGNPKFIPCAFLGHIPDKNCQYLKDDTLVFRVTVQVPNRKPWLECDD